MGLLDRLRGIDSDRLRDYQETLRQVANGDAARLPELKQLSAGLPAERTRKLNEAAAARFVEVVLADEVLSPSEEERLAAILNGLRMGPQDLQKLGLEDRLALAKANDGRPPIINDSELIAQPGELVHAEVPAGLLKEVAIRQWRGGGSGVSFRIAKGVRINTGAVRGRSEVVGTEVQVADVGTLSVTNQRIVFLGERKTIESKYSKLVGLKVYTDAVGISVTNRQNASTFRVGDGPLLAAFINAVLQQSL